MLSRIPLFVLLALLLSHRAASAQVTLDSLTVNNTSACPASGLLPAQCRDRLHPQRDFRKDAHTNLFDPAPENVSTEDLHSYLTQGMQTRIFANFMMAFCVNAGTLCHGNVETGYSSTDAATVQAQAEDLVRRHIDGAMVTWEGAGSTADRAAVAFQSYVEANHCLGPQQCDVSYALMYDGPSLKYNVRSTGVSGTNGAACSQLRGNTDEGVFRSRYENCVLAHIRNDMCYMNGSHFGSVAYEKSNGHPVVQVFLSEDVLPKSGSSPSWADVWEQIHTWNQNLSQNCRRAPYNASNGTPLLVFENAGGFNHAASDGAFAWLNPNTGVSGQMDLKLSPYDSGGTLDHFYQVALENPASNIWVTAYKGFNDLQSSWGRNRLTDQQCGQTWVRSLSEGRVIAPGIPMPYLQIMTWNDYNEGTEIETGIDSCYSISASIVGTNMMWSLVPSDSYADLMTVSHIEIYDSRDGYNLTQIGSVAASESGSYDLTQLASGQHTLYVRMVGKNSIINQLSASVRFSQ